jgi:endonuclease YncB( thermonuclease family)
MSSIINLARLRRKRLYKRSLGTTLLLLLALSTYQFHNFGRITWHVQALDQIQDLVADAIPGHDDRMPPPAAGNKLTGRVVRVTDGDTLTLRLSLREKYIIRLHGIDAPERDQAYGAIASRSLSRLVNGREVAVVVEDRDDYGRLVGRVYAEGRDINLALVQDGHAWWYRQYAKSRTDLAEAEAAARNAEIGLWTDGEAVPPWIWRRRN